MRGGGEFISYTVILIQRAWVEVTFASESLFLYVVAPTTTPRSLALRKLSVARSGLFDVRGDLYIER